MFRYFIASMVLCCLLGHPSSAFSQGANPMAPVSIYLKNGQQAKKGVVAAESIEGIRLSGEANIIPATEIEDVNYEDQLSIKVRINTYRKAVASEKNAKTAATVEDRQKSLKEAIAKFQEAASSMDEKLYAAKRHATFKIAYLQGLLGKGAKEQLDRVLAISKLKDFVKQNPDSWQYTSAMLLLADLQSEQGDAEAAEETIKTLSKAKVSDEVRQNAKLTLVRFAIRAKKYEEASTQLQVLINSFKKGTQQQIQARLMNAECLAAMNKLPEATKDLKEILDDIKDGTTKAIAYNTLGECYYQADQFQEARWPFLWVDVIYNSDDKQHAKALYYLYMTFYSLREFERADTFYDTLVNNSRFQGSEYRQKAIEKRKVLQQQ